MRKRQIYFQWMVMIGCGVLMTSPLPAETVGSQPWVTQARDIRLPPGFRAELVYVVPRESQGSWVCLTVDPQGRLIASDQYGKLYRMTVNSGDWGEAPLVEPLEVALGHAQGLLYAFDSLFVMVNQDGQSGLYRMWDRDGDDRYDSQEQLLAIDGVGEHGPHAIVLSPDRRWLYICAGNHTPLPSLDRSYVPRLWDEDHLLPRFVDPQGHAAGIKAPGGWVCRVRQDGTRSELVAIGFRNEYDLAFNRDGNLFTFDADMEWDLGTPWYRPTRIYHVVAGADYGWRSGNSKWPAYFIDTLPAAVDVGPGSPTGICFGYKTKFPQPYRDALFAADWSQGRLFAVHLKRQGASYQGSTELFASAAALPLTDLVVNPADGALYFTVGGRKIQSAVYRIVFEGTRADSRSFPQGESAQGETIESAESALRHRLEGLQKPGVSRQSLDFIWSQMGHPDRTVRYAARVALEHQPIHLWKGHVTANAFENASQQLTALVALAHLGHRNDLSLLLDSLLGLNLETLGPPAQRDWLRTLQLAFIRLGPPATREDEVVRKLDELKESTDPIVRRELSTLLVYLQATDAEFLLNWIDTASDQQQQMHYLLVLRMLAGAFSSDQAITYFSHLRQIRAGGGGKSYGGYIDKIAEEAFNRLSPKHQEQVQSQWEAIRESEFASVAVDRDLVRQWTVESALQEVTPGRSEQNMTEESLSRGKRLFAELQCNACHRMKGEGGSMAPDLTHIGRRMGLRDLLTTIIDPEQQISDQYRNYVFELDSGKTVTGRVINLKGSTWFVNPDMRNPGKLIEIDQQAIERMKPSKTSAMPSGLVDTLDAEELSCLIQYLLSSVQRRSTPDAAASAIPPRSAIPASLQPVPEPGRRSER